MAQSCACAKAFEIIFLNCSATWKLYLFVLNLCARILITFWYCVTSICGALVIEGILCTNGLLLMLFRCLESFLTLGQISFSFCSNFTAVFQFMDVGWDFSFNIDEHDVQRTKSMDLAVSCPARFAMACWWRQWNFRCVKHLLSLFVLLWRHSRTCRDTCIDTGAQCSD